MGLAHAAIRRLLPSGWAFQFVAQGNADKILQGVGEEIDKALTDAQQQALDGFPATTNDLAIHEDAFFCRVSAGLTEAQRRAKIVASWKDWGNDSPDDFQTVLQAHGFPLYVWEWWRYTTPPIESLFQPTGNGYVLKNGIVQQAPLETAQCGLDTAQCGLETASCGYFDTLGTFREVAYLSDTRVQKPGAPAGTYYYPRTMVLCGATFGTFVNIPASRREELEDLILKRRPLSQWVGLLVSYT